MLDQTTSHLCRISALASCNHPAPLRDALRVALADSVAPLALYETLLQTYLFAGFPPALEGLRALREIARELQPDWHPPDRPPYDVMLFRERGDTLYRRVYASNHESLRTAVEAFSPDMFEYMIVEGYGKVLSRPGLTGAQRELATVTALSALGWTRQTISHCRGALNLGASVDDVFDAIALAEICVPKETVSAMAEAVRPHVGNGER